MKRIHRKRRRNRQKHDQCSRHKHLIGNRVGAYGLIVAGVLVALVLARELIVSGFHIIAAGKRLVLETAVPIRS